MDPQVSTIVKGISHWEGVLRSRIRDQNAALKKSSDALLATLTHARSYGTDLKALAEKRKWLMSPIYRIRVGGYLTQLDSILHGVNPQMNESRNLAATEFLYRGPGR